MPPRSGRDTNTSQGQRKDLAKFVIFAAVVATIICVIYLYETPEPVNTADAGDLQVPPPVLPRALSGMTMAAAVAHCRALWLRNHYDQPPLAVAWQRDRIDWFVSSGVDHLSMRAFSCNGHEVTAGSRYEHFLKQTLPEAMPESRFILNDRQLFDYLASLPDTNLLAMEVSNHPATQESVDRRWLANGTVEATGPDVAGMSLLFPQPPAGINLAKYPAIKELPPGTNWLRNPELVFARLEKEFPPETRFAEIDFREWSIKVTVLGNVKNSENKPPARFGDASFDEYGVRDASWLYPRDQSGSYCDPGYTLKEVAALFFASPNAKNPKVWSATFDCTRGAEKGVWAVRVPRR